MKLLLILLFSITAISAPPEHANNDNDNNNGNHYGNTPETPIPYQLGVVIGAIALGFALTKKSN